MVLGRWLVGVCVHACGGGGGQNGHCMGNEMKEKEIHQRSEGCHVQGPCIPRCHKLSLVLFSVASLVSVFSIFMAVLIKHQYAEAFVESCWL